MKNINEIRDCLCSEIDDLKAKKTTPANVNALSNLVGKLLSTIKLEMEYNKLLGKTPNLKGFITAGNDPKQIKG